MDRERVMTKTWFNDERNRWEMDPVAVPYAVSRKLVESARIRHDWGVMYLALKGDDREYYVDIKVQSVISLFSFLSFFFFLGILQKHSTLCSILHIESTSFAFVILD